MFQKLSSTMGWWMMQFPTTFRYLLLLLVGLTVTGQALLAEEKTIRINVPEGYDEVSYDPGRVTRQELDHWLLLSPVISQNNYFLVPEDPNTCAHTDPTYIPCENDMRTYISANAKHSQDRIRRRLDRLDATQFPPEFESVVSWFRTVQSFGLWRNQQQIDYFETHDIASLERPYEPAGLATRTVCSAVVKQIRESLDPDDAAHIVFTDWHNCTWNGVTKQIGPYPQNAWDAAMKAHGVREHLVVVE
jgi:hypothetical protein